MNASPTSYAVIGRRTKTLVLIRLLSVAISFGWLFLWKRNVNIRSEQLRNVPVVVNRDGSAGWDAPGWYEPPGGITILFRCGAIVLAIGFVSYLVDRSKSRSKLQL